MVYPVFYNVLHPKDSSEAPIDSQVTPHCFSHGGTDGAWLLSLAEPNTNGGS